MHYQLRFTQETFIGQLVGCFGCLRCFGVWGGLFSTFDCTVKAVRKREDAWNAVIAGFFTGGALAIRGGWKHTRNSAITCACLLGVFEGVGMMMQRLQAQPTMAPVYPEEPAKLAA